ncbi:MAG TPA: diaminobutyrate acetyltransferase [Kofleriaceae bacterium]|nr:diaminobutyrate acetyltransferase [Kofleriaceae bacterium]
MIALARQLADAVATEPALRPATAADGAAMWTLARDTKTLDLNSSYAYLLLCDRFADTCVVAEGQDGLDGFVAAFIPPGSPEVVFVWQIGVAESARGRGLGRRLLDHLIAQPACAGTTRLETTITPSNRASDGLFRSFARAHGAAVEVSAEAGFSAAQFPDGKAPELLYRISPIGARP